METSNYLQNRLPTKSQSYGKLILEEALTNQKQSLIHICICGNLNIFHKKRSKSNFQKTGEGIFIGYSSDTTKHFRVWAPQTKEVIVASKLHIDET